MTQRTIDAVAFGPNGNMQGGMRFFILVAGRMLQLQWQDAEIMKMSVSAIIRINFNCKQQKAVKVLKFGDRQNLINNSISAGVIDDPDLEKYVIHQIG